MLQRAADGMRSRAPLQAGSLDDVPSYHITTPQIAELARDADVGEVVLTHMIPPIPAEDGAEEAFMSGMSDVYGGSVRIARDTQRILVKKRGS